MEGNANEEKMLRLRYLAVLLVCVCTGHQVSASAVVVEVRHGDFEDECGVYPPCRNTRPSLVSRRNTEL